LLIPIRQSPLCAFRTGRIEKNPFFCYPISMRQARDSRRTPVRQNLFLYI